MGNKTWNYMFTLMKKGLVLTIAKKKIQIPMYYILILKTKDFFFSKYEEKIIVFHFEITL